MTRRHTPRRRPAGPRTGAPRPAGTTSSPLAASRSAGSASSQPSRVTNSPASQVGTGLALDEADGRSVDPLSRAWSIASRSDRAPQVRRRRAHGAPRARLVEQRAQVVGKQAMEAVPVPLGVEGDQEQVRALGPRVRNASRPRARSARRRARRRNGRRPRSRSGSPGARLERLEDFLGEVVQDERLAPREGLHDRLRVGPVAQGDGGQLDPAIQPSVRSASRATSPVSRWTSGCSAK